MGAVVSEICCQKLAGCTWCHFKSFVIPFGEFNKSHLIKQWWGVVIIQGLKVRLMELYDKCGYEHVHLVNISNDSAVEEREKDWGGYGDYQPKIFPRTYGWLIRRWKWKIMDLFGRQERKRKTSHNINVLFPSLSRPLGHWGGGVVLQTLLDFSRCFASRPRNASDWGALPSKLRVHRGSNANGWPPPSFLSFQINNFPRNK